MQKKENKEEETFAAFSSSYFGRSVWIVVNHVNKEESLSALAAVQRHKG